MFVLPQPRLLPGPASEQVGKSHPLDFLKRASVCRRLRSTRPVLILLANILRVPARMSHADPYADYPPPQGASAPQNGDTHDAPRGRSRSRSPARNGGGGGGYRSPGGRSPPYRRRSPPPRKPHHAPVVGAPPPQNNGNNASANPNKPARPQNPNPTQVLGVFGLSIRTQERDLEEEFGRFGRVEKVTIVYDQRVCFGALKMPTQNLT